MGTLFFRLFLLICSLFVVAIPSVDAAKGGGSSGGTKSQKQSSQSGGTTKTNVVYADDDDDDDGPTVSLSLQNNAQHTKPELEAYLNVDNNQYTVSGTWTYYFDDKQMAPIAENGIGSQLVKFPLKELDPKKPHTIRVKFQGMVDGREYASDRTILLPTLTTAWEAKKRQIALQLSNSEADGKWLFAVRDSKQQLVHACSALSEEKLACDLSKLPAATYAVTVLFSGETQNSNYAFKQTGKLDLQTGKLQVDEVASFPRNRYIDALHTETNWQYAWVQWNKRKVRSPYFPTLQGLDKFSGERFDSLEIAPDPKVKEELNLDGKFVLTFYDKKKKVLHRCTGYHTVDCKTPEVGYYLLQFAGKLDDLQGKKYPVGFEQRGIVQKSKIHVTEQRYIKNPKQLLKVIDAAERIEPEEDEEDGGLIFIYLFLILFTFLMIGFSLTQFNCNTTNKDRFS